ncbi:MAG: hypothetical protein ACRDD2_12240 [Sarcina sp.]
MSEPIYETPNDVPSMILNRSTGIISYLIGSTLSNYSDDYVNLKESSDCLLAFTEKHLIIGELNKGNKGLNNSKDFSIDYNSIDSLNYFENSRRLEIITKENTKFLIKVSKNLLASSLKNLDYDLKVTYKKEKIKLSNNFKLSFLLTASSILALGLLYKIFF